MPDPTQLTIDGREAPLQAPPAGRSAPAHEQEALFTAPQTIRGQLAMPAAAEPIDCEWCGGQITDGTGCPRSVACPTCYQPAGSPCLRPSGHRAPELHRARIELGERTGTTTRSA